MWSDRQTLITLGCTIIGFSLGILFLAMPQYRRASAADREMARLQQRMSSGIADAQTIQHLETELHDTERFHRTALREIPQNADVAGLMRALTVPVDGVTVIDQTLTAGRSGPISADPDGTINALPLTIDMVGHFDVIFDVIRSAESTRRLVRISSVRMERDERSEGIVQATIGLDAIHEADPKPEGE